MRCSILILIILLLLSLLLPETASAVLIAHYKFDDNYDDSSGFGNHGTSGGGAMSFTNGITTVPSIATFFPGLANDEYISVSNTIANDFSISFWIKTTNQGDDASQIPNFHLGHGSGLVCAEMSGSYTNDWSISLIGDFVYFGIGTGGQPETRLLCKTPVTDGEWHNVLVTRDKNTGFAKIWLDCLLETNAFASTEMLKKSK